jgi:hypothetical protein
MRTRLRPPKNFDSYLSGSASPVSQSGCVNENNSAGVRGSRGVLSHGGWVLSDGPGVVYVLSYSLSIVVCVPPPVALVSYGIYPVIVILWWWYAANYGSIV